MSTALAVSARERHREPTRSGACGTYWPPVAPTGTVQIGLLGEQSLLLLAIVTVAGVGTSLLLGIAIAAFVRRQSRPYLLIAAAIGALFVRSVVAGLTMTGTFSQTDHHVLEHGLDVVMVALVVAAVYHARTVSRGTDFNP